jgi:hypothetical protein
MDNNQIITDFNSALNIIDSLSEFFKVDIWIPSLKKFIQFKEMEAKQQKQLLSVAIENSLYNNLFSDVFYQIIKNNLIETDEFKKTDIDSLTVMDKVSIALFLRKQISNKLKVIFDENKKISSLVDLDLICEKIKNFTFETNKVTELNNDKVNLKILLKIPSIKDELEYDKEVVKIFKNTEDIKNESDVKGIITEAFITETSKYIDKILISSQEIDFSSLTLKQKVQIVEKLPSILMQQILEIISDWKTNLDSILTVNHEQYETVIKIDSVLFLN